MTTESFFDANTGKTVTNTYETEDTAPMADSLFGASGGGFFDDGRPGLFGRLGSFLFGDPEPHAYHPDSVHEYHSQMNQPADNW